MNISSPLAGYGAILLIGLGVALSLYILIGSPDSELMRAYNKYAIALDREARLLYLKNTGEQIARWQMLAIGVSLAMLFAVQDSYIALLVGISVVGPKVWLAYELNARKEKIDQQLDTFLTTLANALKVSPSLGDALATCANLMRAPIKEDLEFALKEYRLGTPLDQALVNMSQRIDSRSFNTALTTILIGRQTGGDLPKILERSAATLREMARLEGVVRTKTAEGKGQALVLGCIPFVMVVIINQVEPNWFTPLTSNFVGYIVVGIAAALWLTAIIAARKILDVDI